MYLFQILWNLLKKYLCNLISDSTYFLFSVILLKMAGKSAMSTCSKSVMKFSGPPSPLNKTEPPIYRQIIQYSYYLINTYPHLSNFGISKLIAKEVMDIWKAVNPRLPLLNEITILKMVNILYFKKAKQINRKSLPTAPKKILDGKTGFIIWCFILFLQTTSFLL